MSASAMAAEPPLVCEVGPGHDRDPVPRADGDITTTLLVSRGTMSGGANIASCLSAHGGVHCLTREDLITKVNTYGELATRVAAVISRADRDYKQFSDLRRPYLIFMRRALLQYTRAGRLAYFGYSGHLLLPRLAHLVRVRLIAPLEVRVSRTCRVLGMREAEARDHIRSTDTERLQWARMMYGVDLRDPAGYDLCVNLERWTQRGACELLVSIFEQAEFQPTPESVAQLENERLATEVLAALVANPETRELEMQAVAAYGAVRLVGPFLPADKLRIVQDIAGAVTGVKDVQYEPGYRTALP